MDYKYLKKVIELLINVIKYLEDIVSEKNINKVNN